MKTNQPSQNIKAAPAAGPKDFLLSLVIPCYNESSRVEIMLQGLAEFEEKWKGAWEVIVVDDGSKDDTVQKVQQLADSKYAFLKDKLTVEKMPANGGKGAALKRGVGLAKGDFILTLDTDMSTRPTELINWERKDKDLFTDTNTIHIGSRKHEEGKVEALQSRRIIGGVFNSIVQIFTSLQLKDTQCGFKLYPRDVAMFLFGNMHSKGWAHDVELLHQANLNGIDIMEMPVNWVNQPESKVNVVKDSIMMFIGVLTIALRSWFYNSFILPFNMSALPPERRKQVWSRSIFNILAVLLVIVMPLMSFQFAITGDEHWHFDYGNSVFNYFFHGDTEAQTATSGIQFYGGIFDFITAFVFNVFHPWDHYTTMHFINAIVGAIGIIYAGKLARFFGGWDTGILAMVFLILSPSWFGHNFANPKDIPFSVGYTAGLYFILLFLQALPNPTAKHIFGLICSIGWAMGVRIGGFLLIAYLLLFIVVYGVYTKQLKAVINARIIRQFVIVAAAGYLIAILFWPYAHMGIISKPLEALKIMSNFFVNIGMLYDGNKILSNQVPWYYIPKYILYTAPIIILLGMAIGTIGLVAIYKSNKKMVLFGLFVLFAAVFPLAYAIYKRSSLYDGWRHFLFIYPMLVVVAAIGWQWLIGMKNAGVKYASLVLVIAGLLLPAKFMAANHPYESLYYNEIAGGLKNMYGRYETDYYMLGIKEATEWLMEHEHPERTNAIIGTTTTYPLLAYLYKANEPSIPARYRQVNQRFADFRQDDVYQQLVREYPEAAGAMKTHVVYVRYYERYSKDWDYYIMFSRFVDAADLTSGNWPPSETIHVVKVDGVPVAAIMKRKTKKDLAGFELMKAKKYEEAKAMFLESLKEYPDNDLVWAEMVRLYDAQGLQDSVLYAGQQVLRKHPSDITTYQIMGGVYMKQKRVDEAMKLYKGLEKYNASYSHFLVAYAYAMTGNANAAFGEIDAAIQADPYNEQPYKLGIQIAQQMKDGGKADEYYEKAKKVFPENQEQ